MKGNMMLMENKMYPLELVKYLDKYIVGQRSYKETIAMSIYEQCFKNTINRTTPINPIMVIGPTGSGKTFLLNVLKDSPLKPLNYTIMSTNVSGLTEAGVHGQDVDDIFAEYKKMCTKEKNYSYRGLIHIDEIDKHISPDYVTGDNGNSNRNEIIQHQLMKILDGDTIAGVPTKNILFVFSGAFYKLDELQKKGLKHNPIGFAANDKDEKPFVAKDPIRNDLIEIGFQKEFLGRINQIVKINALNEAELKAILLHPSRGVISKLMQNYASDGIELVVEPDAIDGIIKAVIAENLGARSVGNIVETMLNGAWFHCLANGFNRVTIDKNTISNGVVRYEKVDLEKELWNSWKEKMKREGKM